MTDSLEMLNESLERIQQSLVRLSRFHLLRALNPGKPATEVRSRLAGIGAFSPEAEALYQWHDGTSLSPEYALGDIWLLPGFYLASLDDVSQAYRDHIHADNWRAEWIPLFASGGGDFYVLDAGHAGQPVRHFRFDEVEQPIEFGSLSAMAATIAEAYERGAFFTNELGYIDVDTGKFDPLAAELNPDIPWWND